MRQKMLHRVDKWEIGNRMSNQQHQRGFTLIEILVVLVIVAIITAVAVMAFGDFGRAREEKLIIEQFTRTMMVAQQQAIFTPTVLRLKLNANGYQFLEYDPSALKQLNPWHSLHNDLISRAHAFSRYFQIEHSKEMSALHILFLPNGFVTPFVLVLKGGSHVYTVSVANNGVANYRISVIA